MKNFLRKIADFIRNLFGDLIDILERNAPLAVRVVQILKNGIESHGATIEQLLARTETTKDDEAYEIIKLKLPKLARELAIIDGLADESMSDEQAYQVYIDYLLSKQKEGRAKEYIFLAAQLLGMIIGRKAPIDLLVMITQKAYRIIFK
jgi:hypothetical protein